MRAGERLVHISRIDEHPENARHDTGDVSELAASIRAQGLLYPMLVRAHPWKPGAYELLDGHRRLAACQKLRMEHHHRGSSIMTTVSNAITWIIAPCIAVLFLDAITYRLRGRIRYLRQRRKAARGDDLMPGLDSPDGQPWTGERYDPAALSAAREAMAGPPHGLRTVIYACGCVLTYMARGGARVAPCRGHSRHHDWQAWERQMGASK